MQRSLPIWEIHAGIVGVLTEGNRLVLVAPTGSGKTTQAPQMLLDAGLANHPHRGQTTDSRPPRRIVVLQPRRVAARSVAARVAWERNGPLGGEVGYQIRFDDRTSLGTRICYVTEGVLLRWLQADPVLSDVGVILFDEFHERNLLSDVALALAKQLQGGARPDLKIAVMSATLDSRPVAKYLEDCPVLVSEGQSFPVEVTYLPQPDDRPVSEQAADQVEAIVRCGGTGDVLVFMPGMAEINATISSIAALRLPERLALIPLHGDLPPEEQDRAFAPHPVRKVVVATNVAETSVTIDGVRHVVDSGQARIARYDAERGIQTLFIEPISRASADQRRGRAGRTAPGVCHRLWTESGHWNRPERNTPEIQRSDLAEVVLLLHSLGIRRAAAFDWLDKPDPQAVERAEQLLLTLGALRPGAPREPQAGQEVLETVPAGRDEAGGEPAAAGSDITAVGRQMLRLPMHPRYSRMLVEAARRDCVPAAALCAALVSGRDLLVRLGRDDQHIAEARELFEASPLSDFFTLMRAHRFAKNRAFNVEACRRYGIRAQTALLVEQTCRQILDVAAQQGLLARRGATSPLAEPPIQNDTQQALESAGPPTVTKTAVDDEPLLRCILAGFVDQLCIRRDRGSLECDLTEGRHGTLMRESVVQDAPLFVAATIREVTGRGAGPLTLLGLATAVKREWLEEMFPHFMTSRVEHLFDRTHKRVAAVKLTRFQDLVIAHEHQREADPRAAARCLAEAFGQGWFELPLFNHELKQFRARVNLVARLLPELEFPPLDDAALLDRLALALNGVTIAKEAQTTPLRETVLAHLAEEQRAWLDELAPLSLAWPDGRKVKVLYAIEGAAEASGEGAPEVQAKLHECFDLKEHPRVCAGKLPVRLWLCAPDGKRLESTRDWPAFRANQYPRLKGGLQRKYPSIAWR